MFNLLNTRYLYLARRFAHKRLSAVMHFRKMTKINNFLFGKDLLLMYKVKHGACATLKQSRSHCFTHRLYYYENTSTSITDTHVAEKSECYS
jgi:hypothetical protein